MLKTLTLAALAAAALALVPTTGNTPIDQLGAGLYKGEQGGLYPGGSNTPPAAYDVDGQALAAQIDPDASVVVVALGMSNFTDAISGEQGDTGLIVKMQAAQAAGKVNSNVRIVDIAQNAMALNAWLHPDSPAWAMARARLIAAGLTTTTAQGFEQFPQPQVLLVNTAMFLAPPGTGDAPLQHYTQAFPDHAKQYARGLQAVCAMAKRYMPNVKIAFFQTRIYAGWNLRPPSDPLANEPWSGYETMWGLKYAIEDVIDHPSLYRVNSDATTALLPFLAHGPLAWADGLNANPQGLTWQQGDFEQPGDPGTGDGVHPSAQGEDKLGQLWLDFLLTSPYSEPWFKAPGGGSPPPPGPVVLAAVNFDNGEQTGTFQGRTVTHGKARNMTRFQNNQLVMDAFNGREGGGWGQAMPAAATHLVFRVIAGTTVNLWAPIGSGGSWVVFDSTSGRGLKVVALPAGVAGGPFTIGYNPVQTIIDDVQAEAR